MPLIQLTRQQLHNLVWSKSLRDASLEIGISDVGLKKVCSRYGIPTPPQGYWLKVGPRDETKIPSVPEIIADQVIDIHVLDPASPLATAEAKRREAMLARERSPELGITVDPSPPRLHPMAKKVQTVLLAAKPDDYGCLRCYEPQLPFARVAPASVPRAVALINALLLAFEARGLRWIAGTGSRWDSSASVIVEEVQFQIGVYEAVQRRTHRLTPDELAQVIKWGSSFAPTYDFIPSGQFSIRRGQYDDLMKDGRQGRVETRLGELMTILIDSAFSAREGKRQAAMEAELAAARAARRNEIRRLAECKQSAEEALRSDAESWAKSQQLRAYARAVEQRDDLKDHPKRERWLTWARRQADTLDPLVSKADLAIDIDFQSFDRLDALLAEPEL